MLQGTVRGASSRGRLEEAVGRQRPREDRTGLSRVTEDRGRQTEMEAPGCEITGGAPTTMRVKGQIDQNKSR